MTREQELIIKKTGFLLYLDQRPNIELLDNEEAGILIKAIYSYANGLDIDEKFNGNRALEQVFLSIKHTLIRDSLKYEKRCKKASESALLRWNKESENKLCEGIEMDTNNADRDSDIERESDRERDIDSVIDRDNIPLVKKVNTYCENDLEGCFDNLFLMYPIISESKDACFEEYKKLIYIHDLSPVDIEIYLSEYIEHNIKLGFIEKFGDSIQIRKGYALEEVLRNKLLEFIEEISV